jgi:hypothetical protein
VLPPSAPLAFAVQENAQGCLTAVPFSALDRGAEHAARELFSTVNPCSLNFQSPTVTTYLPNNGITDSQVGVRARMKWGGLDLGLNYYYGRFGFPVALDASVSVTPGTPKTTSSIPPRSSTRACTSRVSTSATTRPGSSTSASSATSRSSFPSRSTSRWGSTTTARPFFQQSNQNVTGQPFVKGAVGVERTFGSWLYVDALFIHGFFDEFNDVYGLHNYVSLTPEFRC